MDYSHAISALRLWSVATEHCHGGTPLLPSPANGYWRLAATQSYSGWIHSDKTLLCMLEPFLFHFYCFFYFSTNTRSRLSIAVWPIYNNSIRVQWSAQRSSTCRLGGATDTLTAFNFILKERCLDPAPFKMLSGFVHCGAELQASLSIILQFTFNKMKMSVSRQCLSTASPYQPVRRLIHH